MEQAELARHLCLPTSQSALEGHFCLRLPWSSSIYSDRYIQTLFRDSAQDAALLNNKPLVSINEVSVSNPPLSLHLCFLITTFLYILHPPKNLTSNLHLLSTKWLLPIILQSRNGSRLRAHHPHPRAPRAHSLAQRRFLQSSMLRRHLHPNALTNTDQYPKQKLPSGQIFVGEPQISSKGGRFHFKAWTCSM